MTHPNVVRFLNSEEYAQMYKADKVKRITYIATERIIGHELAEYTDLRLFSEPMAKYLFRQMLSGLKHIHDKGYSHR